MKLVVTGGAGFIGSHVVRLFVTKYPDYRIVNLDKLTYAGNRENLASLEGDARHVFVKGDIGDRTLVDGLLATHRPRAVVHFAAESHVDRSIHGPGAFMKTNVDGAQDVMNAARELAQTEAQLSDTQAAQVVVSWRLAIGTRGLAAVLGAAL